MPKASKANKKFTKTVIGATPVVAPTPVVAKSKKPHRGSGDSMDKTKWGLHLRRINPEATWGSFLQGCKDSFLDIDGNVLKYKDSDVRFKWSQMVEQVEKLVNINNPFKNDSESREFLEYILRSILVCDIHYVDQEPVEDTEDYEITPDGSDLVIEVEASKTVPIEIADPNAIVFTPYHVHYLVNIVTAYVSKSRTENVTFFPAGKMTNTLDYLHIF
jgi:hypothetical protein